MPGKRRSSRRKRDKTVSSFRKNQPGRLRSMLHEFVTTYRSEIIARAREKLTARPWPSVSAKELNHGVPLFLSQLSDVLQSEQRGGACASGPIGSSATRHGRDLLTLGFTV